MNRRMVRIVGDEDPRYSRGHELEELAPGEVLRADAVDPKRFAALIESGRAVEVTGEQWTLRSSPEKYLERWPDGPHAELARELVAGSAADSAATEEA